MVRILSRCFFLTLCLVSNDTISFWFIWSGIIVIHFEHEVSLSCHHSINLTRLICKHPSLHWSVDHCVGTSNRMLLYSSVDQCVGTSNRMLLHWSVGHRIECYCTRVCNHCVGTSNRMLLYSSVDHCVGTSNRMLLYWSVDHCVGTSNRMLLH